MGGGEPPGQLVAVPLGAEDRVNRAVERLPENGAVRVPHQRIGVVDRVIVDHADEPYPRRRRVHLAQPRQPQVERNGLHTRRRHHHGQPLAGRRSRGDQAVMAGVRRVELAHHQPVYEATRHDQAGTGAVTGSGSADWRRRSARHARQPSAHSPKNPKLLHRRSPRPSPPTTGIAPSHPLVATTHLRQSRSTTHPALPEVRPATPNATRTRWSADPTRTPRHEKANAVQHSLARLKRQDSATVRPKDEKLRSRGLACRTYDHPLRRGQKPQTVWYLTQILNDIQMLDRELRGLCAPCSTRDRY